MGKSEGATTKNVKKGVKVAKSKVDNMGKKATKPVKKAVQSESEDDSDDSGSATSASSESSGSESEEETKPNGKVNGKANGKVNGAAKKTVDSDSDSEGSDSDSEEEAKPVKKTNKKSAAAAKKTAAKSDSESDSDSASDSEDDKMEVDAKVNVSKAKAKANGTTKVTNDKASSDEDDSGSDSDSEGSSGSSGSDDDEDEAEESSPKKRKAEESIERPAKSARAEPAAEEPEGFKNLFVGNLPWSVDEDALAAEFESFGELAGVRIAMDRATGRAKGFGYVEFTNLEDAVKAYEARKGTDIQGRTINLDYARPRDNNNEGGQRQDRARQYGDQVSQPSDTLFVGNIAFDADEDTITQTFNEHATVKAVRLPTNPDTQEYKGFGYVEFFSVDDAKTALEALSGSYINGRPIRLDYSSPRSNDRGGRGGGFNDRGGRGGGRGRGRGGFGDRGGRGGFGDRGGRGRGGGRGGRGGFTTNRGGFGDFQGKKMTF